MLKKSNYLVNRHWIGWEWKKRILFNVKWKK
jgi:hypothetical protein